MLSFLIWIVIIHFFFYQILFQNLYYLIIKRFCATIKIQITSHWIAGLPAPAFQFAQNYHSVIMLYNIALLHLGH